MKDFLWFKKLFNKEYISQCKCTIFGTLVCRYWFDKISFVSEKLWNMRQQVDIKDAALCHEYLLKMISNKNEMRNEDLVWVLKKFIFLSLFTF